MTDDKHIRRGGEEYAHALASLLPVGIAWPREYDSVLMAVVRGLAECWGINADMDGVTVHGVDARAADLLEQESDPRHTIELLPDWERNWGLPDPCYEAPQTIPERQLALVMRMTMIGAQSREFFISICAEIGYPITITEYRPFTIAVDRCGDNRVYGSIPPGEDFMRNEWGSPVMDTNGDAPVAEGDLSGWPNYGLGGASRWYWSVHAGDVKLTWFRCAAGQCGVDPHLRIGIAQDMECLLERLKPAHTEIVFDYSGSVNPGDPMAGTP